MRFVAFLASIIATAALAQDDAIVRSDTLVELLTGEVQSRGIIVRERRPPVGMSVDLRIEFEFDSSTLSVVAAEQLEQLAAAMRSPDLMAYRFDIIGHTDSRGGSEYNLALSEARAAEVKAFLVTHGVAMTRLTAVGKGESLLLFPHRPEDQGNRRVEIVNRGM